MTFEDFWTKVEETHLLSNVAIHLLPGALSEQTKKRILRKGPEEIARILDSVINEINN